MATVETPGRADRSVPQPAHLLRTLRGTLTVSLLATTLALLLSVASTTPASGAIVVLQPVTPLSTGGQNAHDPQVAVGPDGTTTAIWQRYDGTHYRVETATRTPGADWVVGTEPLSTAGQNATIPQIAVAPDGTTTAIWRRYDGTNSRVETATRTPGGDWVVGTEPLSTAGQNAYGPQVAVAPDGTTTAIWRRYDGTHDRIETATRTPDGDWAVRAEPLSTAGQNAYGPQIAVAPDGTTTAVWRRSDGTNSRVETATRTPGADWVVRTEPLSTAGQNAASPQIAVAPDGTTTAIWQRSDGTNSRIETATRTPGADWVVRTEPLSTAGQNASAPQVAVSADGATTAVWYRHDGSGDRRIETATRTPGADWVVRTEPLSTAGQNAYDPQVAVAPDGTTTAIWQRSDGTNDRIETATRTPDGDWVVRTEPLSTAGQNAASPQIAVAPNGTTTAIWRRYDGTHYRVETARFVDDRQGPILNDLEIPETGTVGEPIAVSVVPHDQWSALGETSWTFGDGTPGVVGTSASHVYDAPGSYPVTVTAKDEHGNATSDTRTITITAAAQEPEPEPRPEPRPRPKPQPDPHPQPTPPAPTPAICSGRFVTLTDLQPRTGRRPTVRLHAIAARSLAGRPAIVLRNGRPVARTTVTPDGTITVTAPAPKPPTAQRRARYRITVDRVRSAEHRADRHAQITQRRGLSDGRTRINGRINGITRATRLTLTGRPACGTTKPTTIQVRTDRRGRFAVTLPAPPADVPAVTYRIRHAGRTVTLPTTITQP